MANICFMFITVKYYIIKSFYSPKMPLFIKLFAKNIKNLLDCI